MNKAELSKDTPECLSREELEKQKGVLLADIERLKPQANSAFEGSMLVLQEWSLKYVSAALDAMDRADKAEANALELHASGTAFHESAERLAGVVKLAKELRQVENGIRSNSGMGLAMVRGEMDTAIQSLQDGDLDESG